MSKQKFGVRIWLWIVLAVVIVLSLGWIGYQKITGNKTTISLASPTPTKPVAISPKTSATTTPTSGKTATPAPTATSTPTPESTPPAGWKIDINTVSAGGGIATGASYQVFMRNNWLIVNGGEILWPERSKLYGDNAFCQSSDAGGSLDNCLFKVEVNSGGADITFNDAKITPEDKNIVQNSFQVTEFHRLY